MIFSLLYIFESGIYQKKKKCAPEHRLIVFSPQLRETKLM